MSKLLYKYLRYTGLPFLFKELVQKNKVTILLFHDITPDAAEKAFIYLMNEYNVIDLNLFIEALKGNAGTKIPKKAVIITFDDGLVGNYQLLPLIKKYNIPMTLFLCSSIVDTNRQYWFKYDKINEPLENLKKISNQQKLEEMSLKGFYKDKEYEKPQALNRFQIEEMSELINMQSHTMFHPCLPKCDDQEAKDEVFNSKVELEENYGFKINAISYPNGDYSQRDIELSKMAGYECGITVDYGFNTLKSDPFRLKRLSVNDTNDLNELIVKSCGLWSFLKTRNGKVQNHGFTKELQPMLNSNDLKIDQS